MRIGPRIIAAVVAAGLVLPGEPARAYELGCHVLLARGMEADYLAATTAAGRTAASDAFLDFLRDLPRVSADESIRIGSHHLSTAWWDVAFYRKGAPVSLPQRLTDENLRALLLHPDRDLHLGSLRVAYGIANARMRMTEAFARLHAQISRRMPKFAIPARVRSFGNGWQLDQRFSARARVSNAERARSLTKYTALKLRDLTLGGAMLVGGLLSPVPLSRVLPGRWFRVTDPIFRALERDPKRVLSAAERELLARHGALDVYAKRQTILLRNPKWFKGVHVASDVAAWAVAGAAAVAISAAFVQSAWGDGAITVEELLSDPRYALGEGQVQLINETVPFPHLAIRIGDQVYSYGVDQMTVTRAKEYLQQNLEREPGGKKGFGEKLAEWVKSKRSVQVVTLNLDPAAVARLQRHLTLQTMKRYENVTFMNDCASMVARALRSEARFEIPKVIDPSPSSIIMYFANERIVGNPRVASVRLVHGESGQNPWLHALRNAYINTIEAKFYYDPRMLLPFQVGRATMDKNLSNREIQYHSKAQLAAFSIYRDDAEKMILEDPEISLYMENAELIAGDAEGRKSVAQTFEKLYDREFAKIEKNREADFYDLVAGYYRIQFLNEAEKKILGESSFELSEALHDPKFVAELKEVIEDIERSRPNGKETP